MKAILIDHVGVREEIDIPNNHVGVVVAPNEDVSDNPIVSALIPVLIVYAFVGETDAGMNRPGTPIFRETVYHSMDAAHRYKNK